MKTSIVLSGVALTAAAALLAGCGRADPVGGPATPTSTVPSAIWSAPSGVPSVSRMPGTTRRPMPHHTAPRHTAPHPGPAPHHGWLLADGRHCAWLTGIGRRTVTVDVVQRLTGAAADAAYQHDHPDVPNAQAPNGFYIRNANPRLRTLPVRGDVAVAVQQPGGGLRSISFAELPAYLAGDPAPHAGRLWYAPLWVTVRGDRVISIVEQYLP